MNADQAYAIIEGIKEFIEKYSDVNDGDYDEPVPNKAMKLVQECDELLTWLEKI